MDAPGLSAVPRTERRLRVREQALDVLREIGVVLSQPELARVVNEVSDEVVGFGPIEFLLKDPEVTEVVVNGAGDMFVERGGGSRGRRTRCSRVLHLIERIVGRFGLGVDGSSPWVDDCRMALEFMRATLE